MEHEAEEERKEITLQKEEYERRVAQAKAERERVAAEKEAVGVSWGISKSSVTTGRVLVLDTLCLCSDG